MKDLTIEELKAREAAILRGIAGRLGPSNPSTMPEGAVNPQAPVWHGDEEKPSTLPSPRRRRISARLRQCGNRRGMI